MTDDLLPDPGDPEKLTEVLRGLADEPRPIFRNDPIALLPPGTDRSTWLGQRMLGVGGSDIAAIMGKDSYRDASDVFFSKVNPPAPEDEAEATDGPLYWGNRLEDILVEESAKRLDMTLMPPDEIPALFRHRDYPFALGSLDGVLYADPLDDLPHAIVDAKNVGHKRTVKYLIEAYRPQLNWYAGIFGVNTMYLSCLIGGQKYELIEFEYSDMAFQEQMGFAAAFWHNHVLTGLVPMPGDFPENTALAKRRAASGPARSQKW